MITSEDRSRPPAQPHAEVSFIGRAAELQALAGEWNAVCLGTPRVVLVEGAAGIGKTALVDRFLDGLVDATVLRVSGDESETAIGLAVVDQLLRQAGAPAPGLLGQGAGAQPDCCDLVGVGTLLLQALAALHAGGPVAVVLDDAHWADQASLAAILFAVRRLVCERVLVVVGTRDGDESCIPEGLRRAAAARGGSTLRVPPLDTSELAALAAGLGIELSPHALRRLWGHIEGNPLHARALLGEQPGQAWLDGELLPVPRQFASEVRRRLRRCSDACRSLVQAAAVLGPDCPLRLAASLADAGDSLAPLEEATRASLICERERGSARTLTFTQPLVRAAVYTSLSPARRTELHRGAAPLVSDEAAALRHRALAAIGPDAELAHELAGCAQAQAARGLWAAAAEDYRGAGVLSVQGEQREERMLRAVDAMVRAGQVGRARRLAGELDGHAPGALHYAVLADIAFLGAHPDDAQPLFEEAYRRCDPASDGELAVTVAQRCAQHWLSRLDAEQAVAWSVRALRLAPAGAAAAQARGVQATALAQLGRLGDAHDALSSPPPLDGDLAVALRAHRGWLRLVQDDVQGAVADLTVAGPAALGCGLPEFAALAFAALARAQYAAGAWDDAVAQADRAIAIATEHEDTLPVFVWDAAIAVAAARGDLQTADAHVREAARRALATPERTAWLALARALPAAARGGSRVLDALAPLAALAPRAGLDEPGLWPWQDLYAEALLAAGRLAEADAFLCRHEALAQARGRHSVLCRLARVHARLHASRGEPELALEAFTQALDHSDRVPMPYERALIDLDLGACLRRNGQRRAAAAHLRAARARLDALGARPALTRCERELGSCGLAPAKRGGATRSSLTSPERSVARLVAAGKSNREVAAELTVSVKTVEFHLTRIYARLGVRSRSQLAALARPGADGGLYGEDAELA